MLNKLFRVFAPTRASDPFFGPLVLMRTSRGRPLFWECERLFAPVGASVGLIVDASPDGSKPTDEQRDFFCWAEANYDAICTAVENAFRADSWASQVMQAGFRKDFTLSGFSIPLRPTAEEEWEVSFDSARDLEHLFSATLKGLQVQRVCVDG